MEIIDGRSIKIQQIFREARTASCAGATARGGFHPWNPTRHKLGAECASVEHSTEHDPVAPVTVQVLPPFAAPLAAVALGAPGVPGAHPSAVES